MGFDAAIKAEIGADVSPLQKAGGQIVDVAGGIASQVAKKFEFKDVGRTLATALGLNLQSIATGLVTPFKEAAEAAEGVAKATDRSANAAEALIKIHQRADQQLQALEKSARRLREELEKPAKEISWWRQALAAVALQFGATTTAAKLLSNEQANLVKKAEDAANLAEKELEIERAKQQELDRQYDQQVKNSLARAQYVQQNREELELEAKSLSGRILPAEQARLDILRLQSQERQIDQRIQAILEIYPEQRTQKERETLTTLEQQKIVIDKQIGLKDDIIKGIKDQENAEKGVTAELEHQNETKEEFYAIGSRGRGDSDLSDAELKKKLGNINSDIFQRQVAGQSGGYDWTGHNFDMLLTAQQFNRSGVQSELDFRDKVRDAVTSFGKERAFGMFDITEQRFNQILQGADTTTQGRIATSLEKLTQQADRGFRTVVSTPDDS